jgi:CHRD domain
MLTGDREVPPVVTTATATSDIVVGTDKYVHGGVQTTGIEATAAHIHVGAPGVSGPVAVTLTKTQPDHWSVPDGTKFTAEQYESFKAGNLYINVHSAEHASGEIRAQLKP